MKAEEHEAVVKRLYSTNPMFGRQIREKAVAELTEKVLHANDLGAVDILAQAVIRHPEEEIRRAAERVLGKLKNVRAIDLFCEIWSKSRHPLLERILKNAQYVAWNPLELRVLTAVRIGDYKKITALGREVLPPLLNLLLGEDAVNAAGAREALCQLENRETIDAFCARWESSGNPMLEAILVRARYVAEQPPHLQILTALKCGRMDVLERVTPERLPHLFKLLHHADAGVKETVRRVLGNLQDKDAVNAFCAQWQQTRHPLLEEILVQSAYIATAPPRLVLLTLLKQGRAPDLQAGGEEVERLLLEALDDRDARIRQQALRSLAQARDQARVDRLCRHWQRTGNQELLALIVQQGYVASAPLELRFLTAALAKKLDAVLTVGGDVLQIMRVLTEADISGHKKIQEAWERVKSGLITPFLRLCEEKPPALQSLVRHGLKQLRHPPAVDFLCFVWFVSRHPLLEAILRECKYVASLQLPRLRVLTALKAGKDAELQGDGAAMVRPLVKAMAGRDRKVAARVRNILLQLRDAEAVDVFCEILLTQRHPLLVSLAVQTGYAPSDQARCALFYFITAQWEKLQRLDAHKGYPLLRKGYNGAAVDLKKAVLAVAETHHKNDLLQLALIGRGENLRLGTLGDVEWDGILASLADNGLWPEVARLMVLAPPKWAVAAFRLLRREGVLPAGGGEWWARAAQIVPDGEGEFPVPDLALRYTLAAHKWNVDSLAVHPGDGVFLSGGMFEEAVRIWRTADGTRVAEVGEGAKNAVHLQVAPDGEYFVGSCNDKEILLWSYPQGKLLGALHGHGEIVSCLAFSADGGWLASGAIDRTVRVWRPREGVCAYVLSGHGDEVTALAFSPDGRLLASGSRDRTICLWAMSDGRLLTRLEGHENSLSALGFAPDGRTLISGGLDNHIGLWDVDPPALRRMIAFHHNWVMALAVDAEGACFFSTGLDKSIAAWSLPEGRLLRVFAAAPVVEFTTLQCTPDGRFLLAGSMDKKIRCWSIDWFKPLAYADDADLASVRRKAAEGPATDPLRPGWRMLELLIGESLRRRHDGVPPAVTLGEFIIDLD